jgi:hypothetical protein
MKRILWGVILAACLASGAVAEAHGPRVRVGGIFWVGPSFWWGPYPYYYMAPPVVIHRPAPVYVQPAPAPEPYYWYYCEETRTYYPYVKQCPRGWMRVVPPDPPAGQQ